MMAFDYVATLEAMNNETGKFESAVSRIQGNKAFLAFRRFLTGTDIWKTMNKLMGVLNLYTHFNKLGKKQNEQLIAQINNWKKLSDNMKELNFATTIAGYKSVIELADKFDPNTGQFAGMSGLQSHTVKGMMWDNRAKTGKLEEVGMLMDKGYSHDEAVGLVMDMLKPLQKQQERAALLAQREVELYQIKNPIAKWWKKQENRISDFVNADWLGFTQFIGKGLLVLAVIPIIAFVLFQFFKRAKSRAKEIGEALEYIKGIFTSGLANISEGLGKIKTAFEEENFGMLLSGLWDIGHGLLLILLSGFLAFIILPLSIIVWAIYDSIVAKWDDSLASSKTRWGAAFKTFVTVISFLAAIATGIMIMVGSSWKSLLIGAIVAALGHLFGNAYTGGMRQGLTVVGERGAELVNLPGGSRVYSNSQSRNMARGGGNTINVNVSGHMGTSDAEISRLADKLGREINLRMNRTGAMNTGF